MRVMDCTRHAHSALLLLFLAVLPGVTAAAVRPWCDAPGVAAHPLSVESMAQTDLFHPAVNQDSTRALGIIRAAFVAAQERLRAAGRITQDSPQARALLANIDAQRAGENRKPWFQMQTDPSGDNVLHFSREVPSLRFDCIRETPEAITDAEKANIAYAAYLVHIVLSRQLEAFDRIYAARVATRAGQYERYLANGLPMWPWELAVNGRGEDYRDLLAGPPRWQWVLMRPSAGFEIYWPSRRAATLEASVAVEPVGFVRYTDTENYREWWGISALVTLGSDDNGVGLGGLIRYNNYALGIVRRVDVDDAYVFLSFDLYEKVRESGARAREAKARIAALKKQWSAGAD